MKRAAFISSCGLYRYSLSRIWDDQLPRLVVCMLNPSKADHEVDDPTMLALIHFARIWGYGGLLIVNLYGFRASQPKEMFNATDPIGRENDGYVVAALDYAAANGGRLLVAWGNDGQERAGFFCQLAESRDIELICLGTTLSGAPKHPMARGKHRIPRDQVPLPYRRAA